MEKQRTRSLSSGRKTIKKLEARVDMLEKEISLIKNAITSLDENVRAETVSETKAILYEWLNGEPYKEERK